MSSSEQIGLVLKVAVREKLAGWESNMEMHFCHLYHQRETWSWVRAAPVSVLGTFNGQLSRGDPSYHQLQKETQTSAALSVGIAMGSRYFSKCWLS